MIVSGEKLDAHFGIAALQTDKLPDPGDPAFIGGYPLGLPYLIFQRGDVASIAYYGIPKKDRPERKFS